jgi:indole-3-glycerol phosphate synthase
VTFLDDVLETKRLEVEALRRTPPSVPGLPARSFTAALQGPGLVVIAEIKRRSPSKGQLVHGLDVARTARAYADGGAVAISCLTDARYFGAVEGDLTKAASSSLPVLRKDFVIDELQIDEGAAMGAAAVLLIVRILEKERLRSLLVHARSRGLDALVEVHEESEIETALAAGASILGVNNRDLGTLEVDRARALRLRPLIPKGVLSVAESGVKTREDMTRVADAGFDAVLIGETLVTSHDPAAALRELRGLGTKVGSR